MSSPHGAPTDDQSTHHTPRHDMSLPLHFGSASSNFRGISNHIDSRQTWLFFRPPTNHAFLVPTN